jgi:hypothetical protein
MASVFLSTPRNELCKRTDVLTVILLKTQVFVSDFERVKQVLQACYLTVVAAQKRQNSATNRRVGRSSSGMDTHGWCVHHLYYFPTA